jgi:hypothetical protein
LKTQPTKTGNSQSQRLGQLLRRIEWRQLVLGCSFLGMGNVPLVGPGLIVPVNAFAEENDVIGLVRLPGFFF